MIERIKLGIIQNNTHFIKSFLTHTERVFFFFGGGGGGVETLFKGRPFLKFPITSQHV